MLKILVSACLAGHEVRYDGQANTLNHPIWLQWQKEGRLITVCPECLGGLDTPRPPAEIQSSSHHPQIIKVMTHDNQDVTQAFEKGAEKTLAIVRTENIKLAILKAKSPSCGNQEIYDGQFSGTLIPGAGVTANALMQLGIKVFNEHQLEQAADFLNALEK